MSPNSLSKVCVNDSSTLQPWQLNQKCWEEILFFLPLEDQASVGLVCKYLCGIVTKLQKQNTVFYNDRRVLARSELLHTQKFKQQLEKSKPGQIRKVFISDFRKTSDSPMCVLFQNRSICNNLEVLAFKACDWSTHLDNIAFKPEYFPNLKVLSVSQFSGLPEIVFSDFIQHLPQLQDLRINNQKNFSGKYLRQLPMSVKKLHCDIISNCAAIELTKRLDEGLFLREIYITFTGEKDLNPAYVRPLGEVLSRQVTKLGLFGCDCFYFNFRGMKHLKKLMLASNFDLGEKNITAFMKSCKNVTDVTVSTPTYPIFPFPLECPKIMKSLSKLPHLTSITLDCQVNDELFFIISKSTPQLEIFACNLIEYHHIFLPFVPLTLEGLVGMLEKCKALKELRIINKCSFNLKTLIRVVARAVLGTRSHPFLLDLSGLHLSAETISLLKGEE